MASQPEDRRFLSLQGSLRDARWSLGDAVVHLKFVVENAPDEAVRSDARIAIEAIEVLLRENLNVDVDGEIPF